MNRRQLMALGAATVVVAQTRSAFAQTTPAKVVPDVETSSLDELHKAALTEGGDLIVYAGGDLPNSAAGTEKAFVARFPGMNIRILTDLSKYHDARIDNQLARGRLECDLAHLQTLHDFDRWKAEGRLMLYKPLGWDQVYGDFKDPDGAYTAMAIIAFSSVVNVNLIPEAEAPRGPLDFLDPKLKGKIVLTYPHDDDAVLYRSGYVVQPPPAWWSSAAGRPQVLPRQGRSWPSPTAPFGSCSHGARISWPGRKPPASSMRRAIRRRPSFT